MNLTRALARTLLPPSARSDNARTPIVGPSMVGRYNGINGVMLSEWDAESAVHQAYLANWVVYRCVSIVAEAIASLPFRVGIDPDKKSNYDTEAPLARLLGPPPGGPNLDTTPSELWSHAIASYLVTGRFGWEIEWDTVPWTPRSKVVALWPLVSQYLWPKPTPTNQTITSVNLGTPPPRYFSGFEYRSQPGAPKELSWQQCFFFWRPSLHDYRQPESALQSARMDIAGMIEQSIYDYAFLKNGAVPASVVTTQQFGSPNDFEKFKAQWGYRYGGAANAGKTAFLEVDAEDGNVGQMIDIKTIGASMRDSQSDKRYDSKISAICQAIGVPQSKLDASGRTFSNASAEDETFERNTVIPLATRLQEAINIRLAPFLGQEVGWFDLSSLKTQQGQSFWMQVSPLDARTKGDISLNEERLLLGLSPIADPRADEIRSLENPALPEHQIESDKLDLTVASAADAQEGVAPETAVPKDKTTPTEETVKTTKSRRSGESDADAVKQTTYVVRKSQFDASATGHMRAFFQKQSDVVVGAIRSQRATRTMPTVDNTFDQNYWNGQLQSSSRDDYSATIASFGAWQLGQLGSDQTFDDSGSSDWITRRSGIAAGMVNQTTADDLGAIYEDYAQSMDSIDDLADNVTSYFTGAASDDRASLWGVTETGMAAIFAMNLAANQAGNVQGKYIILGDNPCATCQNNADQGTIPLNSEFSNGDPECHPRCQCCLGYGALNDRSASVNTRATLSSGIMVALMIDGATSAKIAIPNGEPASQLHVTLAYLGKKTDDIDRGLLESTIKDFAAKQTPIAGRIGGKGIFDTPNGWAVVGLVDAPGLDEMRHGLVSALTEIGVAVSNDHSFTPHVTIAYVDDPSQATNISVPIGLGLSWTAMTLAWGATYTPYALAARRNAPAEGSRGFSPLPRAAVADSLPKGDSSPALSRSIEVPDELIARWESTLTGLFGRQSEATLARLDGKRGRQMLTRAANGDIDVKAIFEPEFWARQTADQLQELYLETSRSYVDAGGSSAPVGDMAKKLAVQLAVNTYEAVGRAVEMGMNEADPSTSIAQNLRTTFAVLSESAGTIAAKTCRKAFDEYQNLSAIRNYRDVKDVEAELLALAAGEAA